MMELGKDFTLEPITPDEYKTLWDDVPASPNVHDRRDDGMLSRLGRMLGPVGQDRRYQTEQPYTKGDMSDQLGKPDIRLEEVPMEEYNGKIQRMDPTTGNMTPQSLTDPVMYDHPFDNLR